MGPNEFNKTTIVTITPRYIILNKLSNKILLRKFFVKDGKTINYYDRVGNKGNEKDTQTQDFHLPGIVKKNGQFEINNQI